MIRFGLSAGAEQAMQGQRQRLALRINAILLIQAAILIYLRRERGWITVGPGLGLIGLLAYGQWAIGEGGGTARAYAWTVILYLNAALIFWGISYPAPGLPPALYLLVSNGLIFHLGWGARIGWTGLAVALASMAAIHWGRGAFDPYGERTFMGLMLCAVAMQVTAQTYESAFGLLWHGSLTQRGELTQEAGLRDRSVGELLDQLEQPLAAEAAPGLLAEALTQGLRRARALRERLPPVPPTVDYAAGASQRLLTPLLWVGVVITLGLGLRDLHLEPAEAAIPFSVGAAFAALLGLIRLRPALWRLVAVATLLAAAMGIVVGIEHTLPVHLPEALLYGHVLIAFAGLWLGPGPAWTACALVSGLDLWWLLQHGSQMSPVHVDGGINLLQQWLMLAFVLAPAAARQQALLGEVDQQSQALAASLRVRRRLLGTLFHDAANHVLALSSLADLRAQGMDEAGDAERFTRLRERLRALIVSARLWLFDDGMFGAQQLEAVDLRQLAGGAEELFRERLHRKGLRWSVEAQPSVRVRGQAGLLAEGVLGNLVSNAIKFSPRGGQLQLRSWQQDGFGGLEVQDQGPGLSPAQLAGFDEGQDLGSLPGSEGESGQGLGLGLAREHLRRMGGRLELRRRPQGGTQARFWLPLAD